MTWNGSGTYALPPLYFPEAAGNLVDSTRYNGVMNDIAAGLNLALTKDGQNVPTANLSMGGFKHTSVAPATANSEALVYGQSNASLVSLTVSGTLTFSNTGNFTLTNATAPMLTLASAAGERAFLRYTEAGSLLELDSDGSFALNTNNTQQVFVTTAGNFSIGLSTPANKAVVYAGGATANYLQVTNGAAGPTATDGTRIGIDSGGVSQVWGKTALNFYTAGVQRLSIDSAGAASFSGTVASTAGFTSPGGFTAATGGVSARLLADVNGGSVSVTGGPYWREYVGGVLKTQVDTVEYTYFGGYFQTNNGTKACQFGADTTGGFAQTVGANPFRIYTDGVRRAIFEAAGIQFDVQAAAPLFTGPLAGNATTATTLQTPRAINGVAFDGSAAITITADLPTSNYGKYTPTITNILNVASSTVAANSGFWQRVGNFVTVQLYFTLAPTAAAPTGTAFSVSLPVATNLLGAPAASLKGVFNSSSTTDIVGGISSSGSNPGTANFSFSAVGSAGATRTFYAIFTYEVI